MNDVTIYHNPACGTSRNTLALLRGAGIEPTIVEYLKHLPSKPQLKEIVRSTGGNLRALLREKEPVFASLGLADPKWSDDELLDFVIENPILLNRPIVVTSRGGKLCRPAETVLELIAK